MRVQFLLGPASTVIREHVVEGTVDMVYCDPPFGNEKIWTGTAGSFSDKWQWSEAAAKGWARLRSHSDSGADLMAAIAATEKARAYLGFMADLLLAVRYSLSKRGTLWLHFDDTMGGELRVLGDIVFGADNQIGTVIWKRSTGSKRTNAFARVHDTIACFGRTRAARARLSRIGSAELVQGGWDRPISVGGFLDDRLAATANERLGYPTQKPVSLVRRFVRAASLPGDRVLDPTCGSGTTLAAAVIEGRNAIGIDISHDALSIARARLRAQAQTDLFSEAS